MNPKTRLLLVDDEEDLRLMVRLVLGQHGFDVVAEAADGMLAIEQARTNDIDAVVMDLHMPRLGGIEATAAIKAMKPELPVLFYSAFADESLRSAALAAGASGWVLKGGGSKELVAALTDVAAR